MKKIFFVLLLLGIGTICHFGQSKEISFSQANQNKVVSVLYWSYTEPYMDYQIINDSLYFDWDMEDQHATYKVYTVFDKNKPVQKIKYGYIDSESGVEKFEFIKFTKKPNKFEYTVVMEGMDQTATARFRKQ